ncbi:ATP-binding cassette domain-containing protein [Pseudoroseicyclus tamaricis]|uniref:ABC-F family ATP-binding cassette domain-containing protein n=1 Tax=Pseudoroseicyclus tamaricis TaxID=2705421 RepID=A0A6B2JQ29_9RHOB|nr:ATP-binding cassette domain-containing protein [Pseudoroseicyclus tamaricis]NDV00130.1 ABC-F family ATP-binding cassette domain-containing protein [Pseudoroseicyclus tamaricis]
MPAFLTLSNIRLATPDGETLLSGLSLSFGAERTGLVGPNGAGKSTLLAVMAGAAPAAGRITRSGRIGRLRQSWPDESLPLAEALGVAAPLSRLERIEAGAGSEADFAEADWHLPARLSAALASAGLEKAMLPHPLRELSGGERTRAGIARLHLDQPDLLLLDEPTNNLDSAGRDLVAQLVAGWPGGVVLASHDRALLAGVDRILELSPAGCTLFGGGWPAFAEAQGARRAREAAALDEAERALRQTRAAAQARAERQARRDKAGRASRAKGDQPKILLDARKERAEATGGAGRSLAARQEAAAQEARDRAAARIARRPPLAITAEAGEAHGTVLSLREVALRRGDFALGPLSLEMRAGEHVALEGANGAGKSTLLALVRGALEPEAGELRRPPALAVLDQHVAGLRQEETLLGAVRRLLPGLEVEAAHALLARFAFRNVAAEKPVSALSGGERLRLGLALALGGPTAPQLMILDEPTNHLDIEAVEMLEETLAEYPGALLVASHDSAFLEAIGIDRWLRMDEGRLA